MPHASHSVVRVSSCAHRTPVRSCAHQLGAAAAQQSLRLCALSLSHSALRPPRASRSAPRIKAHALAHFASCACVTRCQGCVYAEGGADRTRIRRHTQHAARAEGEARPHTRPRLCRARSLISLRAACVTPAACSHGVRAASTLKRAPFRCVSVVTRSLQLEQKESAASTHAHACVARAHSCRLVLRVSLLPHAHAVSGLRLR